MTGRDLVTLPMRLLITFLICLHPLHFPIQGLYKALNDLDPLNDLILKDSHSVFYCLILMTLSSEPILVRWHQPVHDNVLVYCLVQSLAQLVSWIVAMNSVSKTLNNVLNVICITSSTVGIFILKSTGTKSPWSAWPYHLRYVNMLSLGKCVIACLNSWEDPWHAWWSEDATAWSLRIWLNIELLVARPWVSVICRKQVIKLPSVTAESHTLQLLMWRLYVIIESQHIELV